METKKNQRGALSLELKGYYSKLKKLADLEERTVRQQATKILKDVLDNKEVNDEKVHS